MHSPTSTRKGWLISLLTLLGLGLTLALAYWYHLEQGFTRMQPLANRQLSEVINFIDGALVRYESIPHVMSTNPMLARALSHSGSNGEINYINRYFEEIQHVTEASDIYLLNNQVTAIAASNWQ